jgi:hypothetical protein
MTLQQAMSIIQPLVQNVLWPLIVFLLPWLFHRAISNLPIVRQILLTGIIKHAVQMVEQKFASMSPEEKRKAAEAAISTLAAFFDLKIDPDALNVILESFVWETKQTKLEVAELSTTGNRQPLPQISQFQQKENK